MLSATSEYALRALALLAQRPGGAVLGRELAERGGIPPQYLCKIMLLLRNAGMVGATRGTGGGYMLLRPAADIRLFDVVALFEGPAMSPHCLTRANRECSDQDPCPAHKYWGKVHHGYLEFLQQTSLNSLLDNQDHLAPVRRVSRRGGGNR